jgi:YidC/Oxa1 family membrane protein insertase
MDPQTPDPDQEKRILLAVVLSVAVLWFFSNFVFEPPPRLPPAEIDPTASAVGTEETPAPTVASDDDDSAARAVVAQDPVVVVPSAPTISLDRGWNGIGSAWSSFGGGPTKFQIDAWSDPYEQDWLPTWLLSGFTHGFEWEGLDISCPEPSAVDIVHDPDGVLLPVGMDAAGLSGDVGHYRLTRDEGGTIEFTTTRGPLELTKSFTLPDDGFKIAYTVRVENTGRDPQQITPTFGVADFVKEGEAGRYGPQPEVWADVAGDVEHWARSKLDKKVERRFDGSVSWVGVGDRYFIVGIEPEQPLEGAVRFMPMPGEDRFASAMELPPLTLAPGEVKSWTFRLWAGPKELDSLDDAGMRMKTAVDFGFFGLIALPILAFLQFIQGFVGSWGISIILLTIAIKLLMFPLSQKAFKSMKAMQALQPEINALKEKHGDDREALNKEMMGLWKDHGVNPAGGCLPMLIQMPIWFALYRVLWNSVELYQTPFLYFCDLSLRDPIGVFPLVLGLTMWLQQKFNPNTMTDPTQQMMIKVMPLFFTVIMFTLPAGLVVYILVNNILSIAQQWVIHRQHDDTKKTPAGAATGSKKKP